MKIRIAHIGKGDLRIKSSAVGTRTIKPLPRTGEIFRECTIEIDIAPSEIIVLDAGEHPARVRLWNCGDTVLLAQVATQGALPISPLTFGERMARKFTEIPLTGGAMVLRCRGAKDRDGIPIREVA